MPLIGDFRFCVKKKLRLKAGRSGMNGELSAKMDAGKALTIVGR
jgi:hypothetical protein